MLITAKERRLTLSCMLNMSAAFHCVDHSILLRHLQVRVGITGVVLDCITSFLTDRTQQVTYNSQLSVMQTVLCGVPRGSVIGPLLYVLYTAGLSEVIMRHGLNVHQYADDTHLYLSVLSVCRTGYYQLRQLRPLVRCLSKDAAKILIQAFINTRLDYCNSLYFGIADVVMSRLQSVQNAATRLITGVRQCEHITPALHQLH